MGAQPEATPASEASLVWHALEAAAGPALVVDAGLRIAGASPGVRRLLGAPVRAGEHVIRVLGSEAGPALAEAFAADRTTGRTLRGGPVGAEIALEVRTSPLRTLGQARGWLVRLGAAPVVEPAPRGLPPLTSRDPEMLRVLDEGARLAACRASALVVGEPGVGKTTLVQAIHAHSARRSQPLRLLGAAGLTPHLLELQLLGPSGRDAEATVLLGDVEELPRASQSWLLRVLESQRVVPTGGGAPRPYDLRLFAATTRPHELRASAGRCRAELRVRLQTVTLEVPPLRARRQDIPRLVDDLLAGLDPPSAGPPQRPTPGALERLQAHDWPGNVRELAAVLEGARALGRGPALSLADVERALPAAGDRTRVEGPSPAANHGEADRLRRALERAGGDRARAAAMLGVSRTTLWRRMRAEGLVP